MELSPILVGILVLVIASFIRQFLIRRQHPPGPLGFPFVGHMPFQILQIFFSKYLPKLSQTEYLMEMKQKYGDIWSLDFGKRRMVVFASIDSITDAFLENGKIFGGKTIQESFKLISENRGMAFTTGESQQNNRQLAIKALRELGMGTQLLENKICNEVDELIKQIEKNIAIPLESPTIFSKATANVIDQLTFSERNGYDDPKLECFIKNVKVLVHSNKVRDIMEIFSIFLPLKYMRKIFSEVDKYVNSCRESIRFIGDKCRSRMKIEGEYSKPNCVFDYFWRYRYQDQPQMDPDEKFLDISHSMFDIFLGGSDTAANTLGFSFLILGQYPDIQNDLKNEIQSLADDYKTINMSMIKDCPKIRSFIDEVQRYCNLAIFLPRRALETCKYKGFKITPNDMVLGDLFVASRDPKLFENPETFNPYRFMDESKTKYIPNKSLIPFGMGKRVCFGESIAGMELFLFHTKILHRFNISLANETKRNFSETLEGDFGLIHAPLDHEIIFKLSD